MADALKRAYETLRESPLGQGWALAECFRRGYGWADLRADCYAALSVTFVALPLALAFAIAAGVPPQYGLYSAIVTGGLVAFLGGSRGVVSGPTASFIAVLFPLSIQYGIGGVLLATSLAGIILIIMGFAHFGKLIQFIPYPVSTGFTAGIGVVIIILQLRDFFGLDVGRLPKDFVEKTQVLFAAFPSLRWEDSLIGVVGLLVIWLLPKLTNRIPGPLAALGLATLLAFILSRVYTGFEVATIGSRYSVTLGGETWQGIAPVSPHFVWPWQMTKPDGTPLGLSFQLIRELTAPAFTIAVLAGMVSLLCASVADGISGTKHNPDRELIALGMGNMIGPFFGAIPAAGGIARTATNIQTGNRSPISAIVHSLMLLMIILLAAPLLSVIPLSAMAAVLIFVAANMIDRRHLRQIIRVAPRSDLLVFAACFSLTILFDMVTAVVLGVVLAALLFMKRMSDNTNSRLLDEEHTIAFGKAPPGVLIYEIAGPLFFGATERAINAIQGYAFKERPRVVILVMDNVPTMDVTALVALESVLIKLKQNKTMVILSGVHGQPEELLQRAGIVSRPKELAFCFDLEQAIMLATLSLPSKESLEAVRKM